MCPIPDGDPYIAVITRLNVQLILLLEPLQHYFLCFSYKIVPAPRTTYP